MKKGLIILAVVVLIGLYVANKVTTANQLEFTVGLPKNVSLKGGSLTFQLPLLATNIVGGSIRIKAGDFDVLAGGKFLGKALITEPVTIAPNGQTTLLVNVNVSYFDLLSAVGSILNIFKSGTLNLTLDGLIYAEGLQFPVKQSFDFTVPKF